MDQGFTLPSFAKINWILHVLGKRADGYHELCTVFQTVSLHDKLSFAECDEVMLECSSENIPTNEKNLIVQAALQLQKRFEIKPGAKIFLEKNIPAPGGLGGGSSNAAVALYGLIRLWKLEIKFDELLEFASALGADVPFFLYGGTAAGTGRGTEISTLQDISEKNILIVTPDIHISTAFAFAQLNAPHLTNKTPKSILQICRDEARALNLRQSKLRNDFEKSVFEIEPEVERVKMRLFETGSRHALLSGSGASVFGVFDSEQDLNSAFDNLKSESQWQIFRARTVSRSDYQEALGIMPNTSRSF